MRLSDYLHTDLVLMDLATRSIEDTVDAFVDRLRSASAVTDPDMVRKSLLDRETSHTTALGNGVALPHATVAGLEEPVVMVGVSPDGVDFCAQQDTPVRLFFLLLSPMEEAGRHIKLLARIVRLVRQPGLVQSLVEAEDAAAVVAELEREDALHV